MEACQDKAGWKDGSFGDDVLETEVCSPKAYTSTGVGTDIDRIFNVPDPATIVLLSLGGTVTVRCRR